jgi:hypothetical protein
MRRDTGYQGRHPVLIRELRGFPWLTGIGGGHARGEARAPSCRIGMPELAGRRELWRCSQVKRAGPLEVATVLVGERRAMALVGATRKGVGHGGRKGAVGFRLGKIKFLSVRLFLCAIKTTKYRACDT